MAIPSKFYHSLAVTATGNAFGVVSEQGVIDKIENWQLQDDMVDWTLIGNVDLGDSWKTSSASDG